MQPAYVPCTGKVLMKGICASLDGTLATGLARMAAALIPPASLLSSCKAAKASAPQARQLPKWPKPRKPAGSRKHPAAHVASFGIALEDWSIGYSTESGALPGHDNGLPSGFRLPFRQRLAIGSVGAELLLPAKAVTACISNLALLYEELPQQPAANATPPVVGPQAAAAAAGDCVTVRMLHIDSVTAGILPPGHGQPAGGQQPAQARRQADGSANAVAAAGPAIDLEVAGVSVRFEPDVAFAAIDTAADLAAVAVDFKQRLPHPAPPVQQLQPPPGATTGAGPAARGALVQEAGSEVAHGVKRVEAAGAAAGGAAAPDGTAAAAAAAASPVPGKRKAGPKVQMAVRVRAIAAEAALCDGVCFSLQVLAVEFTPRNAFVISYHFYFGSRTHCTSVLPDGPPDALLTQLAAQSTAWGSP